MPNGTYKYFFILTALFLQAFATNSIAGIIPPSGWSLLSVDSEELARENGAAVNAFDGDINTIWHTAWSSNATTTPHNIDIYLGNSYQLNGFRYLPRQDGGDNGRINQYELYISTDGINWGTPAASGNFADNALEQEALFVTPETGAFIRLVALSSYDANPWTSVAEITVLGKPASGNQAPESIINTPGTDLVINVGDTLDFTGTGSDIEGDLPLTYTWSFGAGSGIPDANIEDPGLTQFNNAGSFTVSFTVTDSLGLADPEPDVRIITVQTAPPQLLPQTGWSLLSVDSEELARENGAAVNAFDGDINTIWHTAWSSNATTTPHNIDIYLGNSYQLDGFRYLPRQDGGDNGRINQYELYISTDGINWGTPAASGNFADNALEQEALFVTPETGAFIRLVALSSYDADPWTSVAEITVLGKPASGNQAPESIINTPGTDLVINVGDTLDFTGTGSDIEGDLPLTYTWSFGAGSGIPDANIEDPGLTQFNNAGSFTVSFTVTDSLGLADPAPATRIITVNNTVNQAPVGNIDTPVTDMTINVGDSLDFTATSSDPDGNPPLTYTWSFGAGSGIADATIEDPGLTAFNNEGVFTVSFTVTDSLGLANPAPATRIITVNNTVNQAPVGNIDTPVTDMTINVGDSLDFTATSSDPDGNLPLTYLWSFGAGSGIADATIEDPGLTAFNNEGVFTVSFTVTDSLGLADPTRATRIITVNNTVNQAPVGNIDTPVTDMTINVGDSLDFTATSSDPDGNLPLTYLWSFGAGSGIADATIEDPGLTAFNNEGVFTVSFTVTDSLGLADPEPDVRIITVQTAPPQLLPQTGWSLLSVDSEELARENGAAVNAFDGDINTIWHTAWSSNATTTPHNIDIYLGNSYQLDGFRYLPRQDGGDNGRINQYELYISTDGINWGTPAASGNFADNALEQEALFVTPETGAFIRLVALSSYDADPWTSVAEITVLGKPASGNQAPESIINTPGTDLVINVGDTLDFTGTGSDIEGDLPLTYTWSFGAGSGIPDANIEDPGLTQFNNAGSFTVSFTVTDSLGLADPVPDVRIITVQTAAPPQVLPQTGWNLLFVASEELIAENGAAVNAFDGDPLTIWHTAYVPSTTPHPHEIQINLGGTYQLSGLRQLPRQDGGVRGRIKSYAFYTSIDGINWGTPVASGLFPNSAAEQEILFTPVQAAFVRFVALSEFNGGNLTSMAELTLLGDLTTANLAPNGTIDTPLENLIINISDTLDFNGTASDFEGDVPFTYLWNFGAGSGILDANTEDPDSRQFNNEGVFTVSFTVTDSLGLTDPTPASRIIEVCTPPSVSILEPENKHIQTSSTLNVQAHPCLDSLAHAGWGLRFKLINSVGTTVALADDTVTPYQATFTGLLKDEHTVQATLIDGSTAEVGGTTTQVSQIGIGDYYVGVGDSITVGLGDDISTDNISQDGRNSLGGYTPILNNQLTNLRAYPHTVINKGIAGDTSIEGLLLMPSILASNPQAQYFLIQYGTNDAGIPLPSGLNLVAGQSGYNGSFKDNMQQMITLVANAGKQAYLAKIPFAKGSFSGRNTLIQDYNQVIDQLLVENSISVTAPDFYTYFESNQLEYSDDLHPKGTGYQSMANLWFNALTTP